MVFCIIIVLIVLSTAVYAQFAVQSIDMMENWQVTYWTQVYPAGGQSQSTALTTERYHDGVHSIKTRIRLQSLYSQFDWFNNMSAHVDWRETTHISVWLKAANPLPANAQCRIIIKDDAANPGNYNDYEWWYVTINNPLPTTNWTKIEVPISSFSVLFNNQNNILDLDAIISYGVRFQQNGSAFGPVDIYIDQYERTTSITDTTAPEVIYTIPMNAVTIGRDNPTIAAYIKDTHSGIDTASIVLTVNNVDYTFANAPDAFSFDTGMLVFHSTNVQPGQGNPPQSGAVYLTAGQNVAINLDISDRAGNAQQNKTWSFSVGNDYSPAQKGISGSFIQPTGTIPTWTQAQWEAELTRMKAVGMNHIIVQWLANEDGTNNFAHYPTSTWPENGAQMTSNLLNAAEQIGFDVYLGLHWDYLEYEWPPNETEQANYCQTEKNKNITIVDEINALYGSKPALKGFYYPFELEDLHWNSTASKTAVHNYLYDITTHIHAIQANWKTIIAPFAGGFITHDALHNWYHDVLNGTGLDIVAFQDGAGARSDGNKEGYHHIYGNMIGHMHAVKTACDSYGIDFWSDMETFRVVSVYPAPFAAQPANPNRIIEQLLFEQELAAAITCFQFDVYMGPDDPPLNGRDPYDTYVGYSNWYQANTGSTNTDTSVPTIVPEFVPEYVTGTNNILRVTAHDNIAVQSVMYRIDSGTWISMNGSEPTFTALWNSHTITDGWHTVTFRATDTSNNTATCSVAFVIDNSPTASFSWNRRLLYRWSPHAKNYR